MDKLLQVTGAEITLGKLNTYVVPVATTALCQVKTFEEPHGILAWDMRAIPAKEPILQGFQVGALRSVVCGRNSCV